MARCLTVNLHIEREAFLRLYQGAASNVSAQSEDGLRIKFPANILIPYVSHAGIHGRFAIYFDETNKFQRIERLSTSPT